MPVWLIWIMVVLFVLGTIFTLLHMAVTSGLFVGLIIVIIKKAKTDAHEWAAAISKYLTGWGFSGTITKPFDKLAAGNGPAAIAYGVIAAEHMANPANAANEWSNVLPKIAADSVMGPPAKKVMQDILSGASQATIAGDLQPLITSGRAALPQAPIVTQLQQFHALLPQLQGLPLQDGATILQSLGLDHFIPLVAQAKSAAAAIAPDVAKVAIPAALAAGAPGTAPVTLPAAIAGGLTLVASGLQDGHNIAITATPGSPAAAVTPAPAPAPVTQAA